MAGKAITEKWDELGGTLSEKIGLIEEILGGFMAGVGAVLAFSGANIPLGIGLIVAGAGIFASGAITLNWDKMNRKIKTKIQRLCVIIGGFALGLGAILAFSGANLPLGIGLMAAGAVGLATAIALDWEGLKKDVESAFQKFAPLFAAIGVGSMAVGALLLFTGHIGLGLGLLIGGGFLTATTIAFNWNSILDSLQSAWKGIKNWWDDTVLTEAKIRIRELEEEWNIDLNGDGKIGFGKGALVTVGTKQIDDAFKPGEPTIKTPTAKDIALDKIQMAITRNKTDSSVGSTVSSSNNNTSWLGQVWNDTKKDFDLWASQAGWYNIIIPFTGKTLGDYIAPKAGGGLVGQGNLFYAGERGPEFVSSMGNSTAVANTEQMTDAIYKAAYMGMSKALQENGGGMNGFVPATTDDLFIAMRKKASNYNKMTGNSAFA